MGNTTEKKNPRLIWLFLSRISRPSPDICWPPLENFTESSSTWLHFERRNAGDSPFWTPGAQKMRTPKKSHSNQRLPTTNHLVNATPRILSFWMKKKLNLSTPIWINESKFRSSNCGSRVDFVPLQYELSSLSQCSDSGKFWHSGSEPRNNFVASSILLGFFLWPMWTLNLINQ